MPILTTLRRSRATTIMILCATLGLVGTAGAFGACGDAGNDADRASAANTDSGSAPIVRTPTYGYEIVATYPHDPKAFTQGLLWHQGRFFESTGQVKESSIREVELASGRAIRKSDLEEPYFGEGIVIIGDEMFQVTWENGKAFTYDWKTFTRQKTFSYDGEGWGLTTDGSSIIMSNGSNTLIYRDPATFKAVKAVTVTDKGVPVSQLNELEWVKGEIWANVWQSEQIARIDPATGNVLGWIDLTGILPTIDRTGKEDVLNGIGYDAEKDRIFVTGKYWSKLFEIRITPKS
ncbi:MAG: glutaminyl-peptide cyclotransferase [Gemmatimonadaceae bacterium]|nr:glutaminyl-peptide cyclotransferase [Gemmatimonadaceae bacterium]